MPKLTHWSVNPDGMSLEDIAKETGYSYNQVRSYLYHGLTKLRFKMMANEYSKEDFIDCYDKLRNQKTNAKNQITKKS